MSELWDIEAELAYRLEQAAADLRSARDRTRAEGRSAPWHRRRTPGAGVAGTSGAAHRSGGAAPRGWSLRGSGAWSAAR